MSVLRFAFGIPICFVLAFPAWAGHTLSPREQKIQAGWISGHPNFRVATDKDCDCADDIKQMKAGSGGVWSSVLDYHPYVATGDFNADGISDFAVVVIDRKKSAYPFTLLIFNGPFDSDAAIPAYIGANLDLRYAGLFFGPPRPKPYRLIMGRYGTDNSSILVPTEKTYRPH